MLLSLLRLCRLLAVALAIGASLFPQRVKAQPPDRSEPSRTVPFEQARGTLTWPVAGEPIFTFIEPPDGSLSMDVAIRTQRGAVVMAPCDGEVVCTEECRSYASSVIIDAGDGYHILLSGLALVKVEHGQRVSAGQQIGTVPPSTAAGDAPILRVELRKGGQSVDSTPWWRKG
jgi:septal ring factor EnvC (AmiA/AmiB activator)